MRLSRLPRIHPVPSQESLAGRDAGDDGDNGKRDRRQGYADLKFDSGG
jgi:hypothetical protein